MKWRVSIASFDLRLQQTRHLVTTITTIVRKCVSCVFCYTTTILQLFQRTSLRKRALCMSNNIRVPLYLCHKEVLSSILQLFQRTSLRKRALCMSNNIRVPLYLCHKEVLSSMCLFSKKYGISAHLSVMFFSTECPFCSGLFMQLALSVLRLFNNVCF